MPLYLNLPLMDKRIRFQYPKCRISIICRNMKLRYKYTYRNSIYNSIIRIITFFKIHINKYSVNTNRPQRPQSRFRVFQKSLWPSIQMFYPEQVLKNRYFWIFWPIRQLPVGCFWPKWPKGTFTDRDLSFEPITKSLWPSVQKF